MDRSTYRALLEGVRVSPIFNPTESQVAEICPHLSAGEITQIFAKVAESGENFYFATPPLLINHSHQSLCLRAPNGTNHLTLLWAYSHRTPKSYEDGVLKGDTKGQYAHADQAIAFAQQHWGDQLILDNWATFVNLFIFAPWKEGVAKRPYYHVSLTTLQDWSRLWNRCSGSNDWTILNDGICQITHEELEAKELIGGRGGCNVDWLETEVPKKIAEYAQTHGLSFENEES